MCLCGCSEEKKKREGKREEKREGKRKRESESDPTRGSWSWLATTRLVYMKIN